MITNCKNTTIAEELNIMNMFDDDFKMWDEQMSDIERELEQYRLSMEARGYVANPYFDENHADWKEHYYARNGLVMNKFNDFDCFDFVTPEDLKWYEHKREVLELGHTLYERLLTDEEKLEDYRCYCEECRKAA